MKKYILSSFFAVLGLFALVAVVKAETLSIDFESPTYTLGNINGQDGWSKTGPYDVNVVSNTYGFTDFGAQTLRISNAVTSGSFGDHAFAKPLVDSVGEADSTAGSYSVGAMKNTFVLEFDFASTQSTLQPGMSMSVSPDRGDGSRMSYLRFVDSTNGINVYFDDVQGTDNPANFVETQIATDLDRSVTHSVKLTFNAFDGPSNDVVKVWIDGDLKITGTSWENYYRYDSESSFEQSPRIVKTVLFRTGGAAVPANLNNGFLFDNLSLASLSTPISKDQCKKGGWMSFDNPVFKNQGDCVSYMQSNENALGNKSK